MFFNIRVYLCPNKNDNMLRRLGWNILRKTGLAAHLALARYGELHEWGWFRSFNRQEAMDRNGRPLPWLTYPSIYFLESRLQKSIDVFEFGSGSSTLWFAARVHSVTSVEHDKSWYDRVQERMPANCRLMLAAENYPAAVAQTPDRYHLILVDGVERNACVFQAVEKLTDDGVLVFDNSEREAYLPSIEFLFARGFRRLPFRGLTPGVCVVNDTSIFYRPGNCLGI